MSATEFVLGPALESFEVTAAPAPAPAVIGRRQVVFGDPAISPGEIVNLVVLPPTHPDDVLPLNIYAFFVTPPERVPAAGPDRTPDWFFKSGAQSGSMHVTPTDATVQVAVADVPPGVFFVQTILEFPVS